MKTFIQDNLNNYQALSEFFMQAPFGMTLVTGKDYIIKIANTLAFEYIGIKESSIGLPLIEAQPSLINSEFIPLLDSVYNTGEIYKGYSYEFKKLVNEKEITSYYDFTISPIKNNEQEIVGLLTISNDVTEKVNAERSQIEMISQFKNLIMESEVPTVLFRGEDLVVDIINTRAREAWGKDYDVVGMKLEEALPELKNQPYLEVIKNVYRTGEVYKEDAAKVIFEHYGEQQIHYYNLYYKPLRNDIGEIYGVLNMGLEVTSQVKEKHILKKQENRLRGLFASIPLALSVLRGDDFVIEMSNQGTTNLWNKDQDRIEKKLLDVYPEIEHHEIYTSLKEAYQTGKQIKKDGVLINFPQFDAPRFVNYIFTPLESDENEEKSVISVGYDVTDELALKEELKNNENKFKELANSVPQIVWTADPNGQLDYFNEKWYEYSGFSRDLSGDEAWVQIIHPDDMEHVAQVWQNSLQNGHNYEIEFRFLDPKNPGTYRWHLVRALPVKNSKGEILKWMGTSTDIHDFKLFLKQKDDFLAITSHELKTPLTSIKLYAQVLEKMLKEENNEKGVLFAKKMVDQVNRLNALVTDLLDVTKIQNGQLQLRNSEFNFDELCEEIVNQMQMASQQHQIKLELGKVGLVVADRDRISQVMINFISNAIKYSPNATEVHVSTTLNENGMPTFCVKDFGIGMPKEKWDKIFDQFYRVTDSDENTFEGLGLGLYISSQIISRSGGSLSVISELGKGSTFCFSLPKNNN